MDALIKKCKEMADKEDENQLDELVLLEWFFEQNAPTIIPASCENPAKSRDNHEIDEAEEGE